MPRSVKYTEQSAAVSVKQALTIWLCGMVSAPGINLRQIQNYGLRRNKLVEEQWTYEEFVEQVKQKLHEEFSYPLEQITFYKKGFTSQEEKEQMWIRDCNTKYTDIESDELQKDFLKLEIREDEQITRVHRISIGDLFEDYQKKGFEAAFDLVRKGQVDMETSKAGNDRIRLRVEGNYEELKETLIIRPLNYSLHIRDLRGCVYRRFSDFALVLYQVLGNANQSLMTSKIERTELEKWGMAGKEEQIMEEAMRNTMRLYPACVYDKRVNKEVDFLEGDFTRKDITFNQILLSTKATTNGAVALLYPGVVEKMMKIMNGAFYAVFMNINDVMIFDLKDTFARRYVEQAKSSSNLGEMLSGKLYLCDEHGVNPASQFVMYSGKR